MKCLYETYKKLSTEFGVKKLLLSQNEFSYKHADPMDP